MGRTLQLHVVSLCGKVRHAFHMLPLACLTTGKRFSYFVEEETAEEVSSNLNLV